MKEPKIDSTIAHKNEHELMMRVIFGDKELGEIGMKNKVDDMHDILVSIKNVSIFFSGVGSILKWLIIIAAVIGIIKGWWAGVVGYLLNKV